MPAARASAGERNDRAASLIAIVPRSGGKTPVRIFTSVLFPAPFAPIRAWTSPGRTLRLAERSATTEPNLLAMSRASRRFAALFMTTLLLLGRVIRPGGIHPVIPAQAGIQTWPRARRLPLDSRFRGNDIGLTSERDTRPAALSISMTRGGEREPRTFGSVGDVRADRDADAVAQP